MSDQIQDCLLARGHDACVYETRRVPASRECEGHEERILAHQRRIASAGASHTCYVCDMESPDPNERGAGWKWTGGRWICPICANRQALHVGCLTGCGRVGIRRGLCRVCYAAAWKRVRARKVSWGELMAAGLALPAKQKESRDWEPL